MNDKHLKIAEMPKLAQCNMLQEAKFGNNGKLEYLIWLDVQFSIHDGNPYSYIVGKSDKELLVSSTYKKAAFFYDILIENMNQEENEIPL